MNRLSAALALALALAPLLALATSFAGCTGEAPTGALDEEDLRRRDAGARDAATSDAAPRDAATSADASNADATLDAAAPRDGGAGPNGAPVTDAAPAIDAAPGADAGVVVPASAFGAGILEAADGGATVRTLPARAALRPLPGGGNDVPVLTSNNPEVFTGNGVLYTNARPMPTRGGTAARLEGTFGVYLHHLNQSGGARSVTLLVTNPNAAPVTISARGSGYSQGETGGLALGQSPDYRVSKEWILDQPATRIAGVSVAPGAGLVVWTKSAGQNQEVDGRFAITASAPVYVYVVAAQDGTLQKALDVTQSVPMTEAPGDYRASGNPPPPFGREAGVYRGDTWTSRFDVALPSASSPAHVAFMVNTATGGGLSQVQAFPAIAHLTESAREAVGMYGNVYDVDLGLVAPAQQAGARRVRVAFHSLAIGNASRWWDGASLVDGAMRDVRHVPGDATTTLFDGAIAAGTTRRVRFRAMVPGLAAIPQALSVEAF
jgi:hypothetical protein